MLDRLARTTGFQLLSDALQKALLVEAQRKYKNYPRFLRTMGNRWKKYQVVNQVSKFIKENVDFIFPTWFGKMLLFDPSRLQVLEPNTRSDVDFNAKIQYLYTDEEIACIEGLIRKYNIQSITTSVILRQLILSGLQLLGPIIGRLFTRPYGFQPEGIEETPVPGTGLRLVMFISSRER